MQDLYKSCTLRFVMTAAATAERADDGGLMARVAAGDIPAFEEVYERYAGQAFGLANRMMRHPAAAEDVTQEAFLNVWRNAARFEASRGSLRSWLLQIVHHRGIDALRRRARHQRDVGLEDSRAEALHAPGATDAAVLQRDESRSVRRSVANLPVEQREVVELAYFGELTHREMADDLQLPLGTVKGRLRLAHKKLRACSSSLGPRSLDRTALEIKAAG
jgi:RNA polymerase sigma-70 factor, ECF subfamily